MALPFREDEPKLTCRLTILFVLGAEAVMLRFSNGDDNKKAFTPTVLHVLNESIVEPRLPSRSSRSCFWFIALKALSPEFSVWQFYGVANWTNTNALKLQNHTTCFVTLAVIVTFLAICSIALILKRPDSLPTRTVAKPIRLLLLQRCSSVSEI